MKIGIKSIRTFVGSKDFNISRAFYLELGFTEFPIQYNVWGREIFMHDPSGVLWHFATFIA